MSTTLRMLGPSGQIEDVEAVPTTEAKNGLATVLDRLDSAGVMVLTRHEKRCAVLLTVDQYEELVRRAGDPLAKLADQFDEMVAKMQGPGTEAAVVELFGVMPRSDSPAARRSRHG